jgi:hypothetical protein
MDGISSIPGRDPKGATPKTKVVNAFTNFFKQHGTTLDYDKFSQVFDKTFVEYSKKEGTPVAYTILDPKHVSAETSTFFGGETITVSSKGLAGIKEAVERAKEGTLSKREKELLRLIPSKMKAAAEKDEDYVDLDGEIVAIRLRKNDFEAYSKPRGSRAFDSFDYKDELKKADFATLDGAYSYILKVTVGDKDNPVTDVATLAALAEAFDTPQKAFTVVWNHTLNIEKITGREVSQILGMEKYEPVNKDITAALGITRALIDGDSVSPSSGVLSSKAIQSEINVARKSVQKWIYDQYRMLAKAAGFNKYPVVRWQETVITTDGDAVTRASWMQMVDRQLTSRRTAMQAIGLDPDAEIEKLRDEVELMQEGIGIQGSPFQQTTAPGDQGRPKGQPTETKAPVDETETVKRQSKPESPSQQTTERSNVSASKIEDVLNSMSYAQKVALLEGLEGTQDLIFSNDSTTIDVDSEEN